MVTVTVEVTDYQITASEVTQPVTVTADDAVFTVDNILNTFTVTNVSPVISFSTEGTAFDLAAKHRGEWVSGNTYTRNDVVRYEYSLYICAIPDLEVLVSTTPPPDDPGNWELFVFNEWPRSYLTITNWLDVGTDITVGGDASIGNDLQVGGDAWVFGNMTVTNTVQAYEVRATTATFSDLSVIGGYLRLNNIRYTNTSGANKQILVTNGVDAANWTNLADIFDWILDENLVTNNFDIQTNVNGYTGAPYDLTIWEGTAGNYISRLTFDGRIEMVSKADVAMRSIVVRDDVRLPNDELTTGLIYSKYNEILIKAGHDEFEEYLTEGYVTIEGSSIVLDARSPGILDQNTVTIRAFRIDLDTGSDDNPIHIFGELYGRGNQDAVKIGQRGVTFTDGSTQTVAWRGYDQGLIFPTI